MKPNKKMIIILISLVLLLIIGISVFGGRQQPKLQFATVTKQDIKATVSSSGTLTGKASANLHFKGAGKLAYINIKTGDQVFAGQVLAGLDAYDLSIALQQAQNTLKDKQATADKVLDDIHLFQYGFGGFANVGSTNETMTQRQLRTTAEVARDNAFDSVKAGQKALQDSVIISPIYGIVTQAIQVSGQTVTGADLIAQVVDTSEIYFDTDVDESDLSQVSLGQVAEVTLDAYPQHFFQGTVDQIIPQTKTTSSGATVVTVRLKLDNPKLNFFNGLSGQALIINTEVKDALTIPQETLREDNTVLIQTPEGLRSQKVVPGIRSDTEVEIREGLSEGDNVVLNPPAQGLPNRNRGPLQGLFRFLGGGRER